MDVLLHQAQDLGEEDADLCLEVCLVILIDFIIYY